MLFIITKYKISLCEKTLFMDMYFSLYLLIEILVFIATLALLYFAGLLKENGLFYYTSKINRLAYFVQGICLALTNALSYRLL